MSIRDVMTEKSFSWNVNWSEMTLQAADWLDATSLALLIKNVGLMYKYY